MLTFIFKTEKLAPELDYVRNAIDDQSDIKVFKAIYLGLRVISERYKILEHTLSELNELSAIKIDFDIFYYTLDMVEVFFRGNPKSLNKFDAYVYYKFLESENELFYDRAKKIFRTYKKSNKH